MSWLRESGSTYRTESVGGKMTAFVPTKDSKVSDVDASVQGIMNQADKDYSFGLGICKTFASPDSNDSEGMFVAGRYVRSADGTVQIIKTQRTPEEQKEANMRARSQSPQQQTTRSPSPKSVIVNDDAAAAYENGFKSQKKVEQIRTAWKVGGFVGALIALLVIAGVIAHSTGFQHAPKIDFNSPEAAVLAGAGGVALAGGTIAGLAHRTEKAEKKERLAKLKQSMLDEAVKKTLTRQESTSTASDTSSIGTIASEEPSEGVVPRELNLDSSNDIAYLKTLPKVRSQGKKGEQITDYIENGKIVLRREIIDSREALHGEERKGTLTRRNILYSTPAGNSRLAGPMWKLVKDEVVSDEAQQGKLATVQQWSSKREFLDAKKGFEEVRSYEFDGKNITVLRNPATGELFKKRSTANGSEYFNAEGRIVKTKPSDSTSHSSAEG
ncbi:MAG: hypothetical protein H7A36_00595 [Chlamydiales bacterium]|nr:hypothetical protein [Chlamydiales bacterium]